MESISKNEVEQRLLTLCDEQLAPLGYRAVDVDCKVSGRSLVRLFIERNSPEKPQANLDDCADVSRKFGDLLDASEIVPGAYDLEVSTPGLDRRLRLDKDFENVVGSEVKLKLTESHDGIGSQVRGRLLKVTGGLLHLSVSGKEVELPLQAVSRANVIWEMKKDGV